MINYDELNKVLKSYNLPELGVSRVKYCLENPPERSPNSTGNKNNVVCLYPSRKNNVTQLLESHGRSLTISTIQSANYLQKQKGYDNIAHNLSRLFGCSN